MKYSYVITTCVAGASLVSSAPVDMPGSDAHLTLSDVLQDRSIILPRAFAPLTTVLEGIQNNITNGPSSLVRRQASGATEAMYSRSPAPRRADEDDSEWDIDGGLHTRGDDSDYEPSSDSDDTQSFSIPNKLTRSKSGKRRDRSPTSCGGCDDLMSDYASDPDSGPSAKKKRNRKVPLHNPPPATKRKRQRKSDYMDDSDEYLPPRKSTKKRKRATESDSSHGGWSDEDAEGETDIEETEIPSAIVQDPQGSSLTNTRDLGSNSRGRAKTSENPQQRKSFGGGAFPWRSKATNRRVLDLEDEYWNKEASAFGPSESRETQDDGSQQLVERYFPELKELD